MTRVATPPGLLPGMLPGMLLGLLLGTGVSRADNVNGTWSNVHNWPLIPVHAVLLPDQRILTYGSTASGVQSGRFIYDVWDPAGGLAGGHLTLPNQTVTDTFCSSQVVLPGGSGVFIAGGDVWNGTQVLNSANPNTNFFRLSDNTLNAQNNMNRPRWYSTSTVLPNGEIYVQGGASGTDRPEVRQANGTFRLLTGANTSTLDATYPRNFVAPTGVIFGYDSAGKMYNINPAGTGSYTSRGTFTGPTGSDASAAMYRPGKILQFGGNSNQARIIDITSGTPVVTSTGNLLRKRVIVLATVLADGKVLAIGGSGAWNTLTEVTKYAEIWNPDTGVWTQHASGVKSRLYHSIALLLPDASVLVGGGGANSPTTSLPENNTNIEVYYPPYLYGPGGGFAARPVISSAPASVTIGETFPVDFAGSGPPTRVALVKTGSVTHGWNMDQRFVEATFNVSGSRVMVQAPTKAADAPPGFYMLFLLNNAGTPSVAKIVEIPVAGNQNPAVTPVLGSPGNQAGPQGTAVNLQLSATDPNGDDLGYAASGLPPGLGINPLTGLIGGVPTTPGSYNVVVAASDGVNTASANLTWQITAIAPLVLQPLPQPAPVVHGASVGFSGVVANGVNPLYRWYFDDGTPVSDWSSSPDINHVFTGPGVYYVTLTVTDARGVQQQSTVAVTVHFPLTAEKPVASSGLARSATSRLWVVNQDNDSVSVFNTNSNALLAEIPVQQAPRSVAVAPDGTVWVTNKRADSISVIDAGTLAVAATIPLPRGSQPFGLVFGNGNNAAYVALEALGRVLKLDVATRQVTGQVDVGPEPRHLSLAGDGSALYISRFVTPPLPGEGTGTVLPGAAGGEVVEVTPTTLQVVRTLVLRHSSVPDTEMSGSGVPNYLGAAVISPDGTQALVPSKQDNLQRGTLRNGLNLNFQNTVRAVTSRLVLATASEDLSRRVDHDNSSVASAVAFDALGVYAFVALETSREVAVVSAHTGWQVLRLDVGRAPQAVLVSPDNTRLYVSNFMDRTVDVFDLTALTGSGTASVPHLATLQSVTTEALPATVLLGKQHFYDARDPRLALDRYMSCAACHNDGGSDGRTWDLTGMGEGLRNTISLRGRAAGQGFLHWSNNFDELQDFEGQIRGLAGGLGLMADEDFFASTRSQTLGDPKAGLSADLDALAAYVASLDSFAPSPRRNPDGSLTAEALLGRQVFAEKNCAACHGGAAWTVSGAGNLFDVGTLTPASGQRLFGPLAGIDVPTLRDVWATAPYLHDGSAPTLAAAIQAHANVSIPAGDLPGLVAYLEQVGGDEGPAPVSDEDGDGVVYLLDNCTLVPNPDQFDGDNDGYGNACDGDLNNNGVVNAQDTTLFRSLLGTADPVADLNHNGVVNAQDTVLFRRMLGGAPGPSGVAP